MMANSRSPFGFIQAQNREMAQQVYESRNDAILNECDIVTAESHIAECRVALLEVGRRAAEVASGINTPVENLFFR
jgi:hypothetical protein